ncbi:MAG: hypothetical protein M0R77_02290 [Gammaproteobacteria bacterium]|nr:hypothetical protein [Gammaproteobacteria bacterium]
MSKEGFAKEIYQVIGSEPMAIYNHEGNIVYEPEEAESFFLKNDNIMIEINDTEQTLEVSLSDGVDAKSFEDRYGSRLRKIALNNRYKYKLRTYGKKLTPKDFSNTPVLENLYGSSKSSYQKIGGAKVIIRHSTAVNEEKRGARTKNIKQIFVETSDGERFKIPHENLHAARAIAYHLNNEGLYGDSISNKILEMVETMEGLRSQHLTEEDPEKKFWIRAHYISLREELKKNYSSKRRYNDFVNRFAPKPLKESLDFEHWAMTLVPSDRLDEEYGENIVSKYLQKANNASKENLPQIVNEMLQLGIAYDVSKHLSWPIKSMVLEFIEDQERNDIARAWRMKSLDVKRHKLSVHDAIEDICSEFANSESYKEIKELVTDLAEKDKLIPKNPNEITIDRMLARNKKLVDDMQTIKAQEFYGQAQFVNESEGDSRAKDMYNIWVDCMKTIGQGMGHRVATDQAVHQISAKYKISYDDALAEMDAALDKFSSKG